MNRKKRILNEGVTKYSLACFSEYLFLGLSLDVAIHCNCI